MSESSLSRRTGVLVALVAVLGLVTACGSSGGGNDESAAPKGPVACDLLTEAQVQDALGVEVLQSDDNPDPAACDWALKDGHLSLSIGQPDRYEEWTPTAKDEGFYDPIDGVGEQARLSVSDAGGLNDDDVVPSGRASLEVLGDGHSLWFLYDRAELDRAEATGSLEALAKEALKSLS